MTANTPAGAVELYAALMQAGELDKLMELYEPDATCVPEPGITLNGIEEIRQHMAPVVAMRPKMNFIRAAVHEADGIALVSYRWHLTATAPDGTAIDQRGVSGDVLRRRADGSWGVIIDDPNGGSRAVPADL